MTIRRFSFHELSSRLASRVSTTVRASEGLLSVFRAVPVAGACSVFPSKNQTLRAQRVAVTGAAFRGPKRHAGGRTAIRARALVHRTLFTKLGIFHDTGERPPGKRLAAVVLAHGPDAPAETSDHRYLAVSSIVLRFASRAVDDEIRELRLRLERRGRLGGERGDVGGGERRVEARVLVTRLNT